MAVELIAPVSVDGIFTGKVGFLPGESRGSAIAKEALAGRCVIGPDGLAGDEHADPGAHGGAEKAVHRFPSSTMRALARGLPRSAPPAARRPRRKPVDARHHAKNRRISATSSRSAPRACRSPSRARPAGRSTRRCGVEGVAAHVAGHGIAGWYFRVLAPGECAAGDALIHLERPPGAVSLARFNRTLRDHRPSLAALERLATAPGLAPEWMHRIRDRMARLAAYGDPR